MMTHLPISIRTTNEKFVANNATIKCSKTMRTDSAKSLKIGYKESRPENRQNCANLKELNSAKNNDKDIFKETWSMMKSRSEGRKNGI